MLSQQHTFVLWELCRRKPEDPWSLVTCRPTSTFSKAPSQKTKGVMWLRKMPLVATYSCTCLCMHTYIHMGTHTRATTEILLSPMQGLALQAQVHSAQPPSALDYNQKSSALCFVEFSFRAILFTELPYLACREPLNILTCTQNNWLS